MKKIADQEISESVLALLVQEMKRMPTDLQLGLKVASCLGSSVQTYVLDILVSKHVGVNLYNILRQISERGYMDSVDDGTMFSFAHDNTIQQAGRQYQICTNTGHSISLLFVILNHCLPSLSLFQRMNLCPRKNEGRITCNMA